VKQKQREEILETVKTLSVSQRLANIIEGKNLQQEIEDVRRK